MDWLDGWIVASVGAVALYAAVCLVCFSITFRPTGDDTKLPCGDSRKLASALGGRKPSKGMVDRPP